MNLVSINNENKDYSEETKARIVQEGNTFRNSLRISDATANRVEDLEPNEY